MVDLALFRDRVFSGAIVSLMLWAFGLFGIYFFTSLYLQGVLGFSPTRAGMTFVPMALFMATTAASSETVARRFGAHRSVTFGMALMGTGDRLGGAARQPTQAPLDLMPSFIAIGIGGGLTIPLTATVLGVMPAGPGRCRVGRLQHLARARRAAGHHRDRRDPEQPRGLAHRARDTPRSMPTSAATGWAS